MKFLVTTLICALLIGFGSCTKCENCTYIVETSSRTIEEPLGEQCGDDIRALEKKNYNDHRGEARTECE